MIEFKGVQPNQLLILFKIKPNHSSNGLVIFQTKLNQLNNQNQTELNQL